LKEESIKMVDIYANNSCVSCFTDNELLDVKVCGHGICKENCLIAKFRKWDKPWCPLCDPFFKDATVESLKSIKEPYLGLTSLFIAALNGDIDGVKSELKKRDVYSKTDTTLKGGVSPFWVAIKRKHYDIATLIFESGFVDVNAVLKLNGRTVLFDIIEQGKDTEGLLKLLFSKGTRIQVNTMDKDQTTLLHDAAMYNNTTAVKLLLENGAAPSENKYGDTALHIAVAHESIDVVKLLCSVNPVTKLSYSSLNHINSKNGKGAIHVAVEKGVYDITELLLKSGADPNLEEAETGRTPIYICVENHVNAEKQTV